MYKRISRRTRNERNKRLLQTAAIAKEIDLAIIEEIEMFDWDFDTENLSNSSEEDEASFKFGGSLQDDEILSLHNERFSLGNIVTRVMEASSERHRLTALEAVCAIAVLEDANNQFDSLEMLMPDAVKTESVEYASIDARFGGPAPNKAIFPDEGTTPIETFDMKVQRMRKYLAEIFEQTTEELVRERTYCVLGRAIQVDFTMKREEKELIREEKKNTEIVQNLLLERQSMVKVVNDKVSASRVTVKTKEGEQHDAAVLAGMKRRYVDRWEKARAEQASYILHEVQEIHQVRLQECRASIDKEYRVNGEIETFYDGVRKEMLDSVERWRESYEQDLEALDQELLRLRIDKEAQMNRYEEMQELYYQRAREMEAYKVEREERRVRAERKAYLDKMATRIQAWWRGTMVRRGLGPFRKKGKKGNKDKTKGKGRAMKMIEEKQKKGK